MANVEKRINMQINAVNNENLSDGSQRLMALTRNVVVPCSIL